MQSLTCMTCIIFIVSKKNATVKFLLHTDNQLAGRPNTDHYIDLHFSSESKMSQSLLLQTGVVKDESVPVTTNRSSER